jgi:hypothetical protein
MKAFNGYYSKEVSSSLRSVQKNQAYFDTIAYKKGRIDAEWLKLQPQLSKNWSHIWFDRSLSLKNDKLKLHVKITMNNEVMVDRRVGKFEFKSDKFICKSIEEAIEKFKVVLSPYIYTKQSDIAQPDLQVA